MATYERLDYGSDDGSQWGDAATAKLGMYGATPVVQYPDVSAASTFTVTTAVTTSCAGFATAAHLSTFVAQVSSVVAALKAIGLVT